MKLLRKAMLLALAALAAVCTPTMASCQGHYQNGIWQLSNTSITGTFINGMTLTDVTFSNIHWTGRYGTANSDGTITNRIQGTVAPGKSIPSYHRMGDLDIGERYTELSFYANFTRQDGSTGNCYFWYAYNTVTETRYGSANSPGGSDKQRLPVCELTFNSYYDVTWKITDPRGG